jgi:hypothetical protein
MAAQEQPQGVPIAGRDAPAARRQPGAWRLPAAVFALALAVRLVYLFEIRDLPTLHQLVMDAQRYDALAREILDHGWRPREAFYQAPLYPYLLAAVYAVSGRSAAAMRLLQALAGAVTAALAAVAARRLWQPAPGGAAAVAGVLAALYAPAVFYTPLLLKTVPVLLLESAAVVVMLPPRGRSITAARALAAGAALGCAALLQESLLLLAPAAALYLLAAGGEQGADTTANGRAGSAARIGAAANAGAALALLGGVALALAPAALLNRAAGGGLLLTSSQGGMNFYIGNHRGATGTYAALSSGSQTPERQQADARRLAADFASRDLGRPVAPAELGPAAVSRQFWRESWRQIAADPTAWLRLMLRKLRLFWNAYELPDAEGFRVYRRESLLLRCDPVVFGLVAPLAALGLLALARGDSQQRRGGLLLALLAATSCLAVTLFFVLGRYRLAVVPFLLPLAGAGVVELAAIVSRARTATWRGAARPALDLALLAGAGLAVNLPCIAAAEVGRQDAAIEYNLGIAASRWSAAAHADFQRLAASGQGKASPAARERLAQAVSRATRAADYLDEAARASPGFLAAELEWAIARERRGSYLAEIGGYAQAAADHDAARRRLAAALAPGAVPAGADPELVREARRRLAELDAGTAAALNDLGVQLIAAGQLDHAQEALLEAMELAPGQPAPRASLALCWLRRATAAHRRGDEVAEASCLMAANDSYHQAATLAEAAGRTDLASFYRQAEAAIAGRLGGARSGRGGLRP